MGRRKTKKQFKNSITYIIAIVILSILSFLGIENGITNKGKNITNVVNSENLKNITIKTANSINEEFISDNKQNLKVYFFDVGQADSILVVNNEQTMLIDAGNNDDGQLLVNNLNNLGITKIDYLIGTHPHEDHIGGLDDIIKNFSIGTIYMPKVQANTKTFEDVLDAVAEKNLKISTPKINDIFSIGNAECKVLSIDNNATNFNLSSIVIQMKFDGISYLFMGDAEKEVEENILKEFNYDSQSIKSNIIKVGHHGSNTSSNEDFINAVAPELSIISVGKDNSYKHPSNEVIERLNKINSEIYRTDEVGNIFIEQQKRGN